MQMTSAAAALADYTAQKFALVKVFVAGSDGKMPAVSLVPDDDTAFVVPV